MVDTVIGISTNPSTVTGGPSVGAITDSGGISHQVVVLETQAPGADPVPVGAANPVPVTLTSGGLAASSDESTFTAGTTAGLPALGVYNDTLSALSTGQQAVPRLSSTRQIQAALGASSTDGWTPVTVDSVSSAVAAGQLKASAGKIGLMALTNNGTTWAYLKLWDSAGTPTLGTTAPNWNIGIPPNGGNNPALAGGLQFTNGMWMAITGGAALLDTSVVAANQVQANLGVN